MRPAPYLKCKKGFTLIELLIVISLIILITGAIVPSFNAYIDNQGIKQAQEALKDDLRTIQNKALNGEKALDEISGNKVKYWGIRFTSGKPKYTYFVSTDTSNCAGGGTLSDVRDSDTLPGDAVIRSPDGCVFFSFSNGDITEINLPGDNTIIVGPISTESDGSDCKRVVVSDNGLIQVDPSESSCTL